LEHHIWQTDKKAKRGLQAQLYLVDGNGHLLGRLSNANGEPARIDATAILGGQRFPAHQEWMRDQVKAEIERGELRFLADVGSARSDTGVIWEFEAPAGVLPQESLARQNVMVASHTFTIEVPKPLQRHATNVLAQAEMLARNLEEVSGRKRLNPTTDIDILPGRKGASADHQGRSITIGTRPMFSDMPMIDHTFVHELAHNYGFLHGGLLELLVETTRCKGADQISQQAAKWMFMDRMNGKSCKEVLYPNTGLYLYCYARAGQPFLQFMLAHDQPARKALSQEGFSDDEVTVALCNLAIGQDMSPICLAYGLSATPARIELAMHAARNLCQPP
jgi:hypothetical protein